MDEVAGGGSPIGGQAPPTGPPSPLPPPPAGAPPSLPQSPGPLAGFWGKAWLQAVVGSVVAGVVLVVVGELIVFLVNWSASGTAPAGRLARYGLWAPLAFQHVGVQVDVGGVTIPGSFGGLAAPSGAAGTFTATTISVSVSLAFAVAACTLLAMWLLARVGRTIGNAAGGPGWVRGLHGMKVAVPWAIVCVAIALADRLSISVPPNPVVQHAVSIHPAYVEAVAWPLAFGAVLGFAGGFRSAGEGAWSFGGPWGRRLRGVVAGGVWMLVVGLVASFAGLLAMAAVKPHSTAAYFHAVFSTGGGDGALLLFLNVLVLPNMASWVLSASMGSCLGVWASNVGVCGVSYAHFPAGGLHLSAGAAQGLIVPGASLPQLPGAPAGYFAFLLVPVVAVLIGGGVAARRSGARSAGEAAGVGALAGIVFSLAATAAVVLTAITLGVSASVGFSESISAWAGADLGSTLLAALLWGVVGGVVGAVAMRRRAPAGPPVVGTEPPDAQPPTGSVPSTG